MAEYPCTTVPGKIKSLLGKIREIGVPSKANGQWLKSIGFKSTNDPTLLTVLRFIGFADSSGTSTDIWRKYRGNQHQQVLANAIRNGYSELFLVYPDAHLRTAEEITHVVSTSTNAGKQVIAKTVSTFQKLCAEADFSAAGNIVFPQTLGTSTVATTVDAGSVTYIPAVSNSPSLHIDIQVHISPDASPDQIDKIFESMAKHLYNPKK